MRIGTNTRGVRRRILILTIAILASGGWYATNDFGAVGSDRREAVPDGVVAVSPVAPNVLLISVASLRSDHLATAGYRHQTTHHLEDFIAEAQSTEWHFSSSSDTDGATATLITGQSPATLNFYSSTPQRLAGQLPPETFTMAELFANAGYETFGVIAGSVLRPDSGFDRGFHDYQQVDVGQDGHPVVTEVFGLLDEPRPSDVPFFVFIHYGDLDAGHPPDERHAGLVADSPSDRIVDGGGRDGSPSSAAHRESDQYDERLRVFDNRFGELVNGLANRNLNRSTIVVLLGAHGIELMDRGSLGNSGTLYNEQLVVPLAIFDPRNAVPERIEGMSRHVDVLPTILALAGIEYPHGLEGEHLLDPFRIRRISEAFEQLRDDQTPAIVDAALEAVLLPTIVETRMRMVYGPPRRALLAGRWKAIFQFDDYSEVELYDMLSDASERTEVSSSHPSIVARLSAMAETLAPHRAGASSAAEHMGLLTNEEAAALRALDSGPRGP